MDNHVSFGNIVFGLASAQHSTGFVGCARICSKDQAAEWAIPKLAKEHATLLEKAKKAYLGDYDDKWEGMETEIIELVNYLKRSIESSLNI